MELFVGHKTGIRYNKKKPHYMIKHIVTNDRLDEALQDLICNSNFYYGQAQEYFMDMYNTGCRSNELFFPERWTVEGTEVMLRTFKTGKIRYFDINQLSGSFLNCIQANELPYNGISSYQMMAEFTRHFKLLNLHCGEKATQLYAFRYNRARIEYERLKDVKLVMDYMGWTNENVARGYITNTLREVR